MSFKLIVFDWDGTLMDSEARIVACIHAAFADLGVTAPSPAEARDIIGLGLDEAMAVLWPGSSPTERQALVERYRHHFLVANATPSELFPGVMETLDWLRGHGYLLAVATGKSRRGLDLVLGTTALGGYFQATRCADETFSKPHPQMLLEIMDELGARGEETLMVGDTEYDMQMASNAGAHALAVCYGVHSPERLLAQGPLGCLADLVEMPAWLAGRSLT
jgi:phosphoglycolate phosphatase